MVSVFPRSTAAGRRAISDVRLRVLTTSVLFSSYHEWWGLTDQKQECGPNALADGRLLALAPDLTFTAAPHVGAPTRRRRSLVAHLDRAMGCRQSERRGRSPRRPRRSYGEGVASSVFCMAAARCGSRPSGRNQVKAVVPSTGSFRGRGRQPDYSKLAARLRVTTRRTTNCANPDRCESSQHI